MVKKNENNHEKYLKKVDETNKKDFSHLKLESMIHIKKLGSPINLTFGRTGVIRQCLPRKECNR
jgi:hypothetical protein